MATQLTREEWLALGEIAKSRKQLMAQMFRGTHLHFGSSSARDAGGELLQMGYDLYSAISDLATRKDASTTAFSVAGTNADIKSFIAKMADIDSFDTLVQVIGSEQASKLVADVTPIVGVVKGVYDLQKVAVAVVRDAKHLYRHDFYLQGFRPGAPYAAAESIRIIIRRDLTSHSIDFAQQGMATGLKIAGLFVDVGTATNAGIGLAGAVASLGLKLYGIGLDIKDMRAGNLWLEKPDQLSLQVFNDSPILGSYLLASASTSDLINMFVVDIGLKSDWKDDVERMYEQQMEPLVQLARKHIEASPLQLEGHHVTLGPRGTHADKSFFSGLKARLARHIHRGKGTGTYG
jgi:hypothetical protein